MNVPFAVAIAIVAIAAAMRAFVRWLDLFRAKHRSLHGHPRMSRRLARLVPACHYSEDRFFASDAAPVEIVQQRRLGFHRLASLLRQRAPSTIALTASVEGDVSDLQFTNSYRVPPPYGAYVKQHLRVGAFLQESAGVRLTDLDGNV